jgi:hypothetical protein
LASGRAGLRRPCRGSVGLTCRGCTRLHRARRRSIAANRGSSRRGLGRWAAGLRWIGRRLWRTRLGNGLGPQCGSQRQHRCRQRNCFRALETSSHDLASSAKTGRRGCAASLHGLDVSIRPFGNGTEEYFLGLPIPVPLGGDASGSSGSNKAAMAEGAAAIGEAQTSDGALGKLPRAAGSAVEVFWGGRGRLASNSRS